MTKSVENDENREKRSLFRNLSLYSSFLGHLYNPTHLLLDLKDPFEGNKGLRADIREYRDVSIVQE